MTVGGRVVDAQDIMRCLASTSTSFPSLTCGYISDSVLSAHFFASSMVVRASPCGSLQMDPATTASSASRTVFSSASSAFSPGSKRATCWKSSA